MSDAIVDDERSVKYNQDSRADRIRFTVSTNGRRQSKNHAGQRLTVNHKFEPSQDSWISLKESKIFSQRTI